MIETSLFSRPPEDAFAYLETVLRGERDRRKAARQTHPEKHEYWSRRVAEIDEALGALEVLRPVAEVRTLQCDKGRETHACRWKSCWVSWTTEQLKP